MRILICGSRDWNNRKRIEDEFTRIPKDSVIVHGGAKGADTIAGDIATKLGMMVEVHKADWKKHGKSAGIVRNYEMLNSGVDKVIAFWDEKSPGTNHMIDIVRRRDKDIQLTIIYNR